MLTAWGTKFFRNDSVFWRVLSNSGWLLSANTISMALALIQGIIVARALGVEQYGVLALITSYTATINQFMNSRVWETAIKFVIQYREEGSVAKATAAVKLCYLVDALTGVLAFAAIVLTGSLAAGLFIKDASAGSLIQFYAVSVLIEIPVGTSSAILRIGDRFDWLAYQNVGQAAVRLVGVLIVGMLGLGIKGVLSVYLIGMIVGACVLLVLSMRTAKGLKLAEWKNSSLKSLRGEYRRLLGFTIYTNLGATSRLITSRADTLILGWLCSPAEVGLYKLARLISDSLARLFSPIYSAVYPEISRLVGQGEFLQLRSLQKKLSGSIAILVLPICLPLTLLVVWAIPFMFGVEYKEAILPTQIMVWQIIWTPLIWVPGYLLSIERARMLAALNWMDALNYLFLLFWLIPKFGVLGAALATLLRFIGWTLMAGGIVFRIKQIFQPREEGP